MKINKKKTIYKLMRSKNLGEFELTAKQWLDNIRWHKMERDTLKYLNIINISRLNGKLNNMQKVVKENKVLDMLRQRIFQETTESGDSPSPKKSSINLILRNLQTQKQSTK